MLIAACGPAADTPFVFQPPAAESPDLQLAEGKRALAAGELSLAQRRFTARLAALPNDPQASFGLCLIQFQQWLALIETLLGALAGGGSDTTTGEETDGAGVASDAEGTASARLAAALRTDAATEGGVAVVRAKLINFILSDLQNETRVQLERLTAIQNGPADFTFTLDHYRIALGGQEIADIGTEWDRADVYALTSFTRFLHGLLTLLLSQNAETILQDINGLVAAITGGAPLDGALAELLAKNARALTLDPYVGQTRWNEAMAQLSLAAVEILKANELMRAETDDQSDDVLIQNDSLTRAGVEQFGVGGVFPRQPERGHILLLWHGKDFSLRETYERLRDHMAGDVTLRYRVTGDLVTTLGVILDFVRRAAGLDAALGAIGLELPPAILKIIEGISEKTGEEFPKTLAGVTPLLLGIPKDAVELDFLTFSRRPIGLRDLFPNVGTDPFTGQPTFLRSYECARVSFPDGAVARVAGAPLNIAVQTPATALPQTVLVESAFLNDMGERTVLDRETVTLTQDPAIEGLARAVVATGDQRQAENDGLLFALASSEVKVSYVGADRTAGGDGVSSSATWGKGPSIDLLAYAQPCAEDSAYDAAAFVAGAFRAGRLLSQASEPIAYTPYPAVAADGVVSLEPSTPLISPDLNGLLWINARAYVGSGYAKAGFAEGFSPADPRLGNLFLGKLVSALGSLLGD